MKKSTRLAVEDHLYLKEASYFDRVFYLFDTHRTSFLCWVKAFNEEVIGKGNTLVTFDLHQDLSFHDTDAKHTMLAKTLDVDKIRSNIRVNNTQDWMLMGMESGLIDNIIIVSPLVNLEMEHLEKKTEYTDTDGKIHKIKYYDSIESFEKSNLKITSKMLLDIDLDYFKIRDYVKTINFRDKDIIRYFAPSTKLFSLLSKCKIVTIAIERHYTGSKGVKLGEKLLNLFVRLERFKQEGRDPSMFFEID